MSLLVIGAGLGRTGTSSLKRALNQLGLGPCYHMSRVEHHPEHDRLWLAAARGAAPDWDQLFQGYQSTLDWPACHFWRELADHYPEAKIILSDRDPEAWYRSMSNTILPALRTPVDDLSAARQLHREMTRTIVLEQFLGHDGADCAERAVRRYQAHIAEVEASVAPARLLRFDVAQGWQPLCEFLGCAVPGTSFPHVNTTREFQSSDAAEDASHRLPS